MTWYIAGGMIGFALLVLGFALARLASGLRILGAQLRTCEVRATMGQRQIQPALALVQQRVEAIEEPLQSAQRRASDLQSRFQPHPDS